MIDYAWLIPLFPLGSFLLLMIFGKKMREGSSELSIFFVFISFILTVLVLIERFLEASVKHKWGWLRAG
ncbi:NADH-quinone oxidoreductase subunit L, partial [Bacillus thuringiensis]|nr:NADH-quinone oxidoreductase subunit L [Bacillus thuringiensis]